MTCIFHTQHYDITLTQRDQSLKVTLVTPRGRAARHTSALFTLCSGHLIEKFSSFKTQPEKKQKTHTGTKNASFKRFITSRWVTLTRPPTHKKSTNESNCHLHGSVTSNITLADSRHSWRQKYFTNAANNDSLLLLIITGSNTSLYFHWHVWQAYLTEWHICSDNFGDSPSGNIPLLHLFVGTLNTPEDTNTHQFIIIFYLYMWCWIM